MNTILKRDFCIPEEIRNNIIEMIKYNAVGGKMIRGLFAVYSSFVLCDNWDMQMKEEWVILDVFIVGHLLQDGVPNYYRQLF